MGVVSVTENAVGRNSSLTGSTSGDLKREFVVITNARTDNEYTIYADGRIPGHGSPHPALLQAYLQTIDFKCVGAYSWEVSCNYSTRPLPGSIERERVPWFRPAIIQGAFDSLSKQPSEDAYGKPYENSAKTPFSESPTVEDHRPTFQIRKNVVQFPSWFYGLANKRNSNTVLIRNQIGPILLASPYKLKYKPLGFSEVKFEGPFRYIEVSYELAYDENDWELEIRDRGRFYKPERATRMQRVVPFDEGGEQNLNGNGEPLPQGAKPRKITFEPYGEADFSVLPTF